MTSFGHVVTAMITPFDKNGDVDYKNAIKLAHSLINSGTDTILLAGTTGESPTLSHQEEYELFKQVKASIGKKAMVMAGTGSNCTRTAIESTQKAEACGIDAVLQVVPYYNKPSQEGLFQHFSHVAKSTSLPIMLYNIPGRTSKNLEPTTVKRFVGIPNIVAIKEASGSVEAVQQLRAYLPEQFSIYSGDDALTLDFLNQGACGVVSVASHCVGKEIQKMIRFFYAGKLEKAREIQTQLTELFQVLFIAPNPVPVKTALRLMGQDMGSVRLPLVEASDSEQTEIKHVLAALDLL